MLKREDIRVRDPFIVYEDGVYYEPIFFTKYDTPYIHL